MIRSRFQLLRDLFLPVFFLAPLWALFLIFAASESAFAQEDVLILPDASSTDPEPQAELSLPEDQNPEPAKIGFQMFYNVWNDFQSEVEKGDLASANASLGQLLELKNRNSVPGLPEFAEAALQEGNRKMEKRNVDKALSYYRAAAALDPSLGDAHYGAARAFFAQGVRQYNLGVAATIQGFLAPRSSFGGKIYLYSKLILIGLGAIFATAAVFALILFLKYNRLLRHDAEEKFSKHMEPPAANLLIWVLLCLPVLLFLGPLWLIPFWLVLFAPYAVWKERIVAILFLCIFVVAFPLYRGIAKFAYAISDPIVVSYMNAISSGPNPKIVSDFERYVNEHPGDKDAWLMLAYLYKSNDMYEEAAEVLQRMMLDSPADSRAPNNLAIICFRQGETEYAVRLTQKALQLNPRNAIYKYNLSTMLRAKFNFAQAKKLTDEARAADPTLFKDGEPLPQQSLLEVVPTTEYLEKRIESRLGDLRQLFVSPFSILSGALLLLALILCAKVRPEFHAHRCIKCGRAFCRKCQTMDRSYGFCTQCLHIFVKRDGISPLSRREKMSEIDRYSKQQRWLRIFSSILVPGSSDIYDNHLLVGILTMTMWFLCAATVFFALRVAPLSTFESSENASPVVLICLAIAVILFIFTLLRLVRRLRTE